MTAIRNFVLVCICASGWVLLHMEPDVSSASTQASLDAGHPAQTDDVRTLKGIVDALYHTLGGPAGKQRDWQRIRSLHHPSAGWYYEAVAVPETNRTTIHPMSFEEYKDLTQRWFDKNSFYERDVARRVERFGHIAHVWATYEVYRSPKDAEPYGRGINSIQLFNDGQRWWVISILWEKERDTLPLPDQYLPDSEPPPHL